MDKLTNILKFRAQCPFLSSAKSSTIRTLYTHASSHYPSLNRLTEQATGCPVMGPVLASRSRQIAASYASVAGNVDVKKIHEEKGVDMQKASTADIEKCPHASAALSAARVAQELASAHQQKSRTNQPTPTFSTPAKPTGCPFHNAKVENNPSRSVEEGFDYEKFYREELDKKRADNSYRYFNNINRMAQKFPIAHTGKVTDQVEVWCANDYLGMGNNPVVLETMQYVMVYHIFPGLDPLIGFPRSRTLDIYGHGAGGTRNIAGNTAMHLALEDELAALHRKDGALVFSSCYVANDATLSTLGTKFPGCVIFSDKMNHASMIQGMRHSTAKRVIFEHNNLEDLELKLSQYPKSTPKIVAFESVYSMCGSIGPIKEICDLAERYGAITFLDEVSTRLGCYTALKRH